MSSFTVSLIAFAIIFGSALMGALLRGALPAHHLRDESRDVVKLGIGLVGTMAALVLGLLVSSAKSSYDAQSTELTQLSANAILLDRVFAHYGPEAQEERELLRAVAESSISCGRTRPGLPEQIQCRLAQKVSTKKFRGFHRRMICSTRCGRRR